MSTIIRLSGLVTASVGLAHFAKPEALESITKSAFPDNTRQHIAINGGIETLLGVGLAAPKTRRLAVTGSVGVPWRQPDSQPRVMRNPSGE